MVPPFLDVRRFSRAHLNLNDSENRTRGLLRVFTAPYKTTVCQGNRFWIQSTYRFLPVSCFMSTGRKLENNITFSSIQISIEYNLMIILLSQLHITPSKVKIFLSCLNIISTTITIDRIKLILQLVKIYIVYKS